MHQGFGDDVDAHDDGLMRKIARLKVDAAGRSDISQLASAAFSVARGRS